MRVDVEYLRTAVDQCNPRRRVRGRVIGARSSSGLTDVVAALVGRSGGEAICRRFWKAVTDATEGSKRCCAIVRPVSRAVLLRPVAGVVAWEQSEIRRHRLASGDGRCLQGASEVECIRRIECRHESGYLAGFIQVFQVVVRCGHAAFKPCVAAHLVAALVVSAVLPTFGGRRSIGIYSRCEGWRWGVHDKRGWR